jgi:flagellar biosynthesis/type III secretory pathway chaperone
MSSERQLEELLDRELGVAQTLAGILEQERAALVGEASHAVATLASKKAALLEQLEKLESERKSLGAAAGAAQERQRSERSHRQFAARSGKSLARHRAQQPRSHLRSAGTNLCESGSAFGARLASNAGRTNVSPQPPRR